MASGSTKAVCAALFENFGIEVNLIDGLDTDKIELVTDRIEQEILKILPESKKEYLFVEIEH